jgi:hypothetical protein
MLLLATMAFGQAKEDAGDGKMLDKQTMEFKDYLPEIHGTIRGKYEYQTETSESRFEVRNARFSVSGNVHPIVAYKAEIDLSDEGSIKMLDAYARTCLSGERPEFYDWSDARSFHNRRSPFTTSTVFCKSLIHS